MGDKNQNRFPVVGRRSRSGDRSCKRSRSGDRSHNWLCLALLLCGGCGLSKPLLLSEDPAFQEARNKSDSKAWKIESVETRISTGEQGGDDWQVEIDPETMKAGVASALQESGLFSDGTGNCPAFPLRLELDVTKATSKFSGTNGNYVPGMATWWLLSPFFACMIADEDYSAEMSVKAELVDVESGKTVWETALNPRITASLDHFQRGLSIWDLLPPGPGMAKADPENVGEKLTPHLCRKIEIEILTRLASELEKPKTDILVVIAGDDPGERDLNSISALFKARPGRKHVIEMRPDAGSAGIRKLLSEMAAWSDLAVGDLQVFYSGKGTFEVGSGEPKPAIAPSGNAADALPVDELTGLLAAISADTRTLWIDSGFSGEKGRAIPPVKPKGDGHFPIMKRDGVVIISACSTDEPGFEPGSGGPSSSEKNAGPGLLAGSLKSAIDELMATGKAESLTAADFFTDLSWNLSRKLRLSRGVSLTPVILGEGVLWRFAQKDKK